MTKRLISIGIMFLFTFGMVGTPAHCDDAVRKLGRGICNVATCALEIPTQIARTNNNDGPMAALTYGVVKGIGMTFFRAFIGVYEIATFPIPCPRGYRPILKDPEFFLEERSW